MHTKKAEVVVAGHICLDVIPKLYERKDGARTLLDPGQLVVVGPAVMSTGGAVSNAGLALHRLGIPTVLMGKVGDDLFGGKVLDILRGHDRALAESMSVTPGEPTSYSIVISPPGVDRMFLHCSGTNDTFGAGDVDYDRLSDAKLFHFGYPPIMRRIFSAGGRELERLLIRVRKHNVTTSLDMSMPDPESESGRVDWKSFLKRVLPYVDVFIPSFDEILFMLDRGSFAQLKRKAGSRDMLSVASGEMLSSIGEKLLNMGAAVVGIKLGNEGLYLRTTADPDRLSKAGRCFSANMDQWTGRELLAPVFKVKVVGTTGSGDSTIAGFIAGLVKGLPPQDVLTAAVAVGASNVEKADAVSGVPSWSELRRRIDAGWRRNRTGLNLPGWKWNRRDSVWSGITDKSQTINKE
ncbi:MAG TPA: carbohydrate kinase family protein [Candidatus Kryptobacter bacterium]|nr:carbohydrate kinase family protein [Candidatus Kryptobacter bacterium]